MGAEKLYTVYCHIFQPEKMCFGITSASTNERCRDGKGYGDTGHFALAIKKYRWENIKHMILFTGQSKKMACEVEKALITKYKATALQYGYDITDSGRTEFICNCKAIWLRGCY